MKNTFTLAIIFALSFFTNGNIMFHDEPVLTSEDIDILTGEKWTGYITYLDYQSNLETKIEAGITVKKPEANEKNYILYLEYPKEPHANNTDIISLSEDGRFFDTEKVIEKSGYSGDSLKFITESSGTDDDKEAIFRHTYDISRKVFIIRKNVKYAGDSIFIKRNEYYFTR